MKKKFRFECKLCLHRWNPKKKVVPEDYFPQECPKCKRRDWKK